MLNHNGTLIKEGPYDIRRTCVAGPITIAIIAESHERIAGGHFATNITLHKVRTALYWWPTMMKDVYFYCTQYRFVIELAPKS